MEVFNMAALFKAISASGSKKVDTFCFYAKTRYSPGVVGKINREYLASRTLGMQVTHARIACVKTANYFKRRSLDA